MDRFRQLEAFAAVVDTGSFVKAAEFLHASKAAVSRSVAELEARLGARLLQRTTRRLSLTDAGRAYYERSKQLLADLDEADSAIAGATARIAGPVKVNAPVSFGMRYLAPLWGSFLALHADVELDVSLSDRSVDLVEEGYDLAIRISQLRDSSLVSRRLAGARLILCAAPAYLERHGMPRSLDELAHHRSIGYSYLTGGDRWTFESDAGPVSVVTRPCMRANNGESCRAVALAGQGVILQPDFLVGDDLQRGALVELLPQLRGPEYGIHALYPSRRHLSAKVRALIDHLEKGLAGLGSPK